MSINPYEAPQTFDAPNFPPDDPEVIRKSHINTEASIKSIGGLYFLAGIFMLMAGIGSSTDLGEVRDMTTLANWTVAIVLPLLGIFLFVVGAAVRKLKPWSRIGVGVLSGFGLFAFPIGTLINAYILFLTFGKKGRMIFSDRYKEIILVTPQVKCRTSKVVWILLGLVIAIIALVFVGAFLAR